MLVFNNRRMLHGRGAFSGADGGGGRWLRGCYVSIDEFANRYNLLERRNSAAAGAGQQPSGAEHVAAHLGNQDWARGYTTLPPAQA